MVIFLFPNIEMKAYLTLPVAWAVITLFSVRPAAAQLRLPRMVRDSMILQRDQKINIWGWASAGERVSVTFAGKGYKTHADTNGKWRIEFSAMKAGGPYTMTITGNTRITLHDILIGDVWFCSGQSNMVHQMKLHAVRYEADIASAHYPEIRQFWIPTLTSLSGPLDTLPSGYWKSANPTDVRDFSAVAYFFARDLYRKYHVPIGIINASVGGTPIEAWMSREAFQHFPSKLKLIDENKDSAYLATITRWHSATGSATAPSRDLGLSGPVPWYSSSYAPNGWRRIGIPGYWEDQGVSGLNGVVWYRREIEVPRMDAGKEAKVFLGRIVDADALYVNGQQVAHTTYQYPERRYTIPAGVLKPGKNLFVVRVTNYSGKGGFVPDKPYQLMAGTDTIDLKGYWQYKVGAVFPPVSRSGQGSGFSAQNAPTALYNAMVSPVIPYTLKGILWYQGVSNSGNAAEYGALQQAQIHDWRRKWGEGTIPFLFVQLPGYGDFHYSPSESQTARIREGQLQALSLPNTAMAVIIDLGEWNDVHPDRKEPVGHRLALAAEKLAYGENLVYSGPLYQSARINGNKMIISFTHVGSGLIFKDSSYIAPAPGEVEAEIAIAGADRKFVWAKAKIISPDKLEVWSEDIAHPVAVRYGWADDPVHPDLYNKEGLPASPFRTDAW